MNDSVIERARAGVEALVCALRSRHDVPSLLEALDGIAEILSLITSAAEHLPACDAQDDSLYRAYAASLRSLLEEVRRVESALLGERERLMQERLALSRAEQWAVGTRRVQ